MVRNRVPVRYIPKHDSLRRTYHPHHIFVGGFHAKRQEEFPLKIQQDNNDAHFEQMKQCYRHTFF